MAVILLIDNDPLQSRLVTDNLRLSGHAVLCAKQEWEGLWLSYSVRPDLIIIGSTPSRSVEILTLLRAMRGLAKTPVLLITSDQLSMYHLTKLGVASCVDKSIDPEVLLQHTHRLIRCAAN